MLFPDEDEEQMIQYDVQRIASKLLDVLESKFLDREEKEEELEAILMEVLCLARQ
jgi:hypothetical protein